MQPTDDIYSEPIAPDHVKRQPHANQISSTNFMSTVNTLHMSTDHRNRRLISKLRPLQSQSAGLSPPPIAKSSPLRSPKVTLIFTCRSAFFFFLIRQAKYLNLNVQSHAVKVSIDIGAQTLSLVRKSIPVKEYDYQFTGTRVRRNVLMQAYLNNLAPKILLAPIYLILTILEPSLPVCLDHCT